ncbi:insulinoma-associated protein 2 [Osmerus eperlanus]|uniref:insulinoma-associated protein 2 n=1 Tax=Osmerus eperlanus TaxID=29151 RepID=UPI002E1145DC
MPRGFLVKRSNKRTSSSSYRARTVNDEQPSADFPLQTLEGSTSVPVEFPNLPVPVDAREPWTCVAAEADQAQLPEGAERVEVNMDFGKYAFTDLEHDSSPGRADLSYSPIKPVGTELEKSFFDRCLTTATATEPFPMPTPVSSIERLLMNHASFGHADMKYDPTLHLYPTVHHTMKRTYIEPERKAKSVAKKPKVIRKLSYEDEVTTSPVLGLRIKKESPELKPPGSSSGNKKPLGEFICQLCKEEYPDPFSLAQHKCSRIVRVEYRCPECDKVFSCPANLASHRRWHKPRPANNEEATKKIQLETRTHDRQSVEGKENASELRVNNQHQSTMESSQCKRAVDSSHSQEQLLRGRSPDPPPYDHRYRTISERSIDLHIRSTDSPSLLLCPESPEVTASPFIEPPGAEEMYDCRYCGKKFRRQAYLRKHLAAHETIKASPYTQLENGQITFPCHLCGAHFPSAEIRDKHRLWHAMRDELLVGPTGKNAGPGVLVRPELTPGDQQIYTCKHCPSTFYSSPGLTRHINKSHPTETRQVMLLQMAVRPGC